MARTELAGLPEGGPATTAAVKAYLTIADTRDDEAIDGIVKAVNRVVRSWPASLPAVGQATWDDESDVVQGAVMLAARLFRRKGSPAGVESFGSLGAAYVMRTDPDIAMLLQIGPWAPPSVG